MKVIIQITFGILLAIFIISVIVYKNKSYFQNKVIDWACRAAYNQCSHCINPETRKCYEEYDFISHCTENIKVQVM